MSNNMELNLNTTGKEENNMLENELRENNLASQVWEPMAAAAAMGEYEAPGLVSGHIYNIKNDKSGKYLNVHLGKDENGTNIYQWTKDNSTEQKFKLVYDTNEGAYRLFAMCSNNGNGRVVDMARGYGSIADGTNVHLWSNADPQAQLFRIIRLGENRYRIYAKANTELMLTANGTSNGSANGTSPSSAGNVYIAKCNSSNCEYQAWNFEPVETKVTGINITPSSIQLKVGDSKLMSTPTFTPADASNKAVTWQSSNESVATISSGRVICAKKAGQTTITARANDGSGVVSNGCVVTVEEPKVSVTGVSISKSSYTMNVNDTYQLSGCVIPSNATNKGLTWSSSDTSVATVGTGGLVCAKSEGTTLITVKTVDGNYSANCLVTVSIYDGIYYIRNCYSGKYLEVFNNSTDNGARLQQYDFIGEPSMQWVINKEGDYYTFAANNTLGTGKSYNDKYLYANTPAQEMPSIQNIKTIATHFKIEALENGNYLILPRSNETMALSLPSATATNGTIITFKAKNNLDLWMQWELEPLKNKINNIGTFASYNLANDALDESDIFHARMRGKGFYAVDWRDLNRYELNAKRILDMSRYADVLYINGHGGQRANIMLYDNNGTLKEYLYPGGDYEFVGYETKPRTEVGLFDKSIWNYRTKWIVMVPCSQLNHEQVGEYSAGAFYNGNTAAMLWAKTMKSSGNKLHGMIGYYFKSPDSSAHIENLNKFFGNLDNMSILEAWKEGHKETWYGTGKRNWAVMYHESSKFDEIRDWKVKSNSLPSANEVIYYEARENPTESLGISSANYITTIKKFGSDSTSTLLSTKVKNKIDMYKSISVENKILSDSDKERICSELESHGKIIVDNNEVSYIRESNSHTECFDLDYVRVVNDAKIKLKNMGILPNENEYTYTIDGNIRYQIKPNEKGQLTMSKPEIIKINITFLQKYNDCVIFSKNGNGISMSYDKKGLLSMDYKWFVVNKTLLNKNCFDINIDNFYEKYVTNDYLKERNSIYTEYAYMIVDGKVKYVKVYSDTKDYTNAIFIDIDSGEVIS